MSLIQFIQLTPEELQNDIVKGVKKELDQIKKDFQPKNPTIYLTRSEVAEMLKIDLSTVHNWTKRGKLTAYGIGKRVYYKRAEVEEALVKLK